MNKPHNALPQRHSQMFELLRQKQQADIVMRKVRVPVGIPQTDFDAQAFQTLAVQSLAQRRIAQDPVEHGTPLRRILFAPSKLNLSFLGSAD